MEQLQIIVFIKQVPDPEGPSDSFKVDPGEKRVIPVGIPPVINPFDENALEVALRLKERHGAQVKVISMGEQLSQPVLRNTLAAGADDLILLIDTSFRNLISDSIAHVLSSSIRIIGRYDLILTGRQAADWDFGVTGLLIAEILHIPSINLARKIEVEDNKVLVEKLNLNGYEIVKAPMPVLVTISGEAGELRYTSVRSLQAVSKKPVKIYNAEDLGIDPRNLRTRQISNLYALENKRRCRLIEGESPQEKGGNLALMLKKEGVF
jgi:electron transfer flavoprotein beta subunit